MPNDLDKQPFTEADFDEVQFFECGDLPWQKELSDWLKRPAGEEGALTSINNRKKPGRVWIYRQQDGTLVGFGAMGKSNWKWKGEEDPRIPITMVTGFAVHKDFHGKPEGDRGNRYAVQIFDDLVNEANKDQLERPVMGLYVHEHNSKAINLYVEEYGFTHDGFELALFDGILYYKMYVILNDHVLVTLLEDAFKKTGKKPKQT